MFERFTDRARQVMALANQEAQRLNHEYIGTEHILAGLIKEGSGVASHVLRELGVDMAAIRKELDKVVKSGPDMVTMGKLPQTPRSKDAIKNAIKISGKLGDKHVGTEHLLLGLLSDTESLASQILTNLGIEIEEVEKQTIILVWPENSTCGGRTPNADADAKRKAEWEFSGTVTKLEQVPITVLGSDGSGIDGNPDDFVNATIQSTNKYGIPCTGCEITLMFPKKAVTIGDELVFEVTKKN